ncbi:MAG: UspA protein [Gemmatimonadetes bacterium]|nr:UspA protein [Gemmatimonadota bacterium]
MLGFPATRMPSPETRDGNAASPRVVIGVDFSPPSLSAGRWALAHVARGARAIIAHVLPPTRGDARPNDVEETTRGLAGYGATLNVASTQTAAPMGNPSRMLREVAGESDASLVIMGRRMDANRRRIGEGNVVERLTRTARTSVLVVPEGVTAAPRVVIAALDESLFGASVLAAASSVALACGYSLIVMHVQAPESGAYDRVIDGGNTTRRRSSQSADASSALLLSPAWLAALLRRQQTPDDTRSEVAAGDPARELVGRALAVGDALLVVGKRGADATPRGSVGSVARALLARSPVPVLAVEVL